MDESHPDVEVFNLLRGERDGQRQGDRGAFERLDLGCGRYPIHRFSEFGRFPGLADRHAKHVRCGLRPGSKSGTATEIYSIYIGGTHWDEAYGIAVAPDGTIWLAGGTYSPDIWIQGNPYQGLYGGDGDAYVAHISPGLGAKGLLYASFLGGNGIDEATSLVLDPSGRIILSGYTLSSNFPVTSNAFQTKYGGDTDAFIAVLDTAKRKLVYSTYFGGPESGRGDGFEGRQQRRFVPVRLYGVGRAAIHQRMRCRPIMTAAWMRSA